MAGGSTPGVLTGVPAGRVRADARDQAAPRIVPFRRVGRRLCRSSGAPPSPPAPIPSSAEAKARRLIDGFWLSCLWRARDVRAGAARFVRERAGIVRRRPRFDGVRPRSDVRDRRARRARQRRERPRDGLRRHAAVDDARSHLRPADASDRAGAGRRAGAWPSGSARPGAAFLEAFLIGFEVECKIAEAIDPDHYHRGFHTHRHDRHLRRGGRGRASC